MEVTEFTRRQLLSRTGRIAAAGATVTVLPALLTACGGGGEAEQPPADTGAAPPATTAAGGGETTAAAELEQVSYQLPWVKDAESSGEFIADDKGYFTEEGFDVTLEPGGADIAVEPLIQSGKSLIGLTTPIFTANAVNEGAALVIIGAKFQKNPFAITSLAAAPIKTPQEMVGKKIGVGVINEGIWTAFLQVNNIDPASVTKVPVQFDPTPLAAGEVDGWLSFYTTEPIILKFQGVETYTFSMGDFNLVSYGDVFIVKREVLEDDVAVTKAAKMMRAVQRGWQGSIDDPDYAGTITAEKYGADLGLDKDQQIEQCKVQKDLIVSPVTDANGLFYMAEEDIAGNVASMEAGGTSTSADLFSNAVLDRIKSL